MLQSVNLLEVAKQFPDMSITVRLEDLMEANRSLLAELLEQESLEREKRSKEETCLTRDQVMDMLNISPTTLWRWMKQKYLVPIEIGAKRLYLRSEVERLLKH